MASRSKASKRSKKSTRYKASTSQTGVDRKRKMKERNEANLYSLNKRGLALVFNQEHNRPGSNVDMAKLLPCLGKFFEVIPYWNLDAAQIKDTIEKIKETGVEKYSSLIIISMSHGGEDGCIEAGNGSVMNIDDLVNPSTQSTVKTCWRSPRYS